TAGRGPARPTGRQDVVDRRAVARQPRQFDSEAGGGERLRHRPHRRGVAGEAVDAERSGGAALTRPRLGPGHQVSHVVLRIVRCRGRCRTAALSTTRRGSRPAPTRGTGRFSSPGTPADTYRTPSTA